MYSTTDYGNFEDASNHHVEHEKPINKSDDEIKSSDRDTWFTEQCLQSGEEELYTKGNIISSFTNFCW